VDAADIQPPIPTKPPYSQGGPQAPGGKQQALPKPTAGKEALDRISDLADRMRRLVEKHNGRAA